MEEMSLVLSALVYTTKLKGSFKGIDSPPAAGGGYCVRRELRQPPLASMQYSTPSHNTSHGAGSRRLP